MYEHVENESPDLLSSIRAVDEPTVDRYCGWSQAILGSVGVVVGTLDRVVDVDHNLYHDKVLLTGAGCEEMVAGCSHLG